MFTVIGVGLFGLGLQIPIAWAVAWFWQWPLWCAAAAGVLAVLVRLYHRFEAGVSGHRARLLSR